MTERFYCLIPEGNETAVVRFTQGQLQGAILDASLSNVEAKRIMQRFAGEHAQYAPIPTWAQRMQLPFGLEDTPRPKTGLLRCTVE